MRCTTHHMTASFSAGKIGTHCDNWMDGHTGKLETIFLQILHKLSQISSYCSSVIILPTCEEPSVQVSSTAYAHTHSHTHTQQCFQDYSAIQSKLSLFMDLFFMAAAILCRQWCYLWAVGVLAWASAPCCMPGIFSAEVSCGCFHAWRSLFSVMWASSTWETILWDVLKWFKLAWLEFLLALRRTVHPARCVRAC